METKPYTIELVVDLTPQMVERIMGESNVKRAFTLIRLLELYPDMIHVGEPNPFPEPLGKGCEEDHIDGCQKA